MAGRLPVMLAVLVATTLVAGCSQAPAAPAQLPADPAPAAAEAEAGRTGHGTEPTYTCESTHAAAVGAGQVFLAGAFAKLCPDVELESAGEPFRSGRLVMEWSQPAPTLVDAYVELVHGDQTIASGSGDASPVVVEFEVDPTTSLSGTVYYGGTGVAAALEVTITIEMFASESPPAPAP